MHLRAGVVGEAVSRVCLVVPVYMLTSVIRVPVLWHRPHAPEALTPKALEAALVELLSQPR